MNATHFFERLNDRSMPQSSESFWTAIFALFMVHMSHSGDPFALWRPLPSGPPWYERKDRDVTRPPQTRISLRDLAIEPCEVSAVWPTLGLQPDTAGISPDIVARFRPSAGDPFFLLVENKVTTGASLNPNQTDAYPRLLDWLKARGVSGALWVLHPVGCSQKTYAATRNLEARLTDRFGIVLWEDVFRMMRRADFELPGLDVDDLQQYLDDANRDCKQW